jgi:protocatechuate 3,4-dioxygenase beta subunit
MMNTWRIALSVFLFQAVAPQTSQASIEGHVLNTAGSAIARATVTLAGPETDMKSSATAGAQKAVSSATFTTDENGKFTFAGLQHGVYWLSASRNGYTSAEYGQRGPHGSGIPITITAEQNLKTVMITLVQKGAISGRILDRNGQPAVRTIVQAFQYGYRGTIPKRQLTQVQAATTDDEGNFRLVWLSPGAYIVGTSGGTGIQVVMTSATTIVSAGTQAQVVRIPKGDGTFDEEASVPSYYPGTTVEDQATLVQVHEGETVSGIEFFVKFAPTHHVRGRITNTNSIPYDITFRWMKSNGPSSYFPLTSTDGSFDIGGVLSGEYMLNGKMIVVGDRDVENIEANPFPNKILAKITIEPQAPGDTVRIATPRLVLIGMKYGETSLASSGPNGPLSFIAFPDDYLLIMEPSSVSSSLYLKSAQFENQDALGIFHVDGNESATLDIHLDSRKGTVEGRAFDSQHQPLAVARVVLIPDPPLRHRSDMYVSVTTDAAGRFQFTAPPGSYKVFAWEDVETGAWMDSEFISKLEYRGQPVHVPEGGKETLDVMAIPYAP